MLRTFHKCNDTFFMRPDRGVKLGSAYYGYNTINSASAASGYQKSDSVTVHLYENMYTGLLSLHIILSAYGNTTGGNATITVSGLPINSSVTASDDTGEALKTTTTTAIGTHSWAAPNTDGFVIDNIQDYTEITISIANGYAGVSNWNVCSYSGKTMSLPLASNPSITISRSVVDVDVTTMITANPPAGEYATDQSVVLTATGLSLKEDLTTTPIYAKYIAYDNTPSANPFIAVVDDGRGRVVFDGGFPKYYSASWNSATAYSQLSSAHQFFYNALNWIVNPEKVRAGNKNILIFNDGPSSYDINHFQTTLDGIAAIAEYTLTHKNRNNFGGAATVSIQYSELDSYAAIVVFSTAYSLSSDAQDATGPSGITSETAALFKLYREAGNGLFIITDHYAFQGTANAIASQFNANFYGNVNRSPVSVDYLKSTYGYHPLWNNITGNVYAGSSEGIVDVNPERFPDYTGATIAITGTGIHTIYVLAWDVDDNYYTINFNYFIGVPDPIHASDVLTVRFHYTLGFSIDRIANSDTSGFLRVNSTVIDNFLITTPSETFSKVVQVSKGKNDVSYIVLQPQALTKTTKLTRYTSNINPLKLSSVMQGSRGVELEGVWGSLATNINAIDELTESKRSVSPATNAKEIYNYFKIE